MTRQSLQVGIIDLKPGRNRAARAHGPALPALPPTIFGIVGIANFSPERGRQAAAAMRLP